MIKNRQELNKLNKTQLIKEVVKQDEEGSLYEEFVPIGLNSLTDEKLKEFFYFEEEHKGDNK